MADPAAAARQAVESPLDHPPLSAAVVPGDRIVLAVEPGVPQAAAIVAGVIRALLAGGVDGLDITVVSTGGTEVECGPSATDSNAPDTAPEPTSFLLGELPPELRAGIAEIRHRPEDAGSLAYLAATDDADPIYLNRRLCDADLVVPIGVQRLEESIGYLGLAGGVYPTFSDVASRQRSAQSTRPTGGNRARNGVKKRRIPCGFSEPSSRFKSFPVWGMRSCTSSRGKWTPSLDRDSIGPPPPGGNGFQVAPAWWWRRSMGRPNSKHGITSRGSCRWRRGSRPKMARS